MKMFDKQRRKLFVIRVRLFKTNDVVSERDVKISNVISQICQYFLLKKCEKLLQCKSFSHFFNKNFSVFGYKVVKHLPS